MQAQDVITSQVANNFLVTVQGEPEKVSAQQQTGAHQSREQHLTKVVAHPEAVFPFYQPCGLPYLSTVPSTHEAKWHECILKHNNAVEIIAQGYRMMDHLQLIVQGQIAAKQAFEFVIKVCCNELCTRVCRCDLQFTLWHVGAYRGRGGSHTNRSWLGHLSVAYGQLTCLLLYLSWIVVSELRDASQPRIHKQAPPEDTGVQPTQLLKGTVLSPLGVVKD